MRKILFAAFIATGMAFGLANAGFAHDVKNEHKGCDKAKVCLRRNITCGKLGDRLICYPTTCGPANCDRTSTWKRRPSP